MKKLFYTIKQNCNDYTINDIKVSYETFKKIFYDYDNYKQVNYTCYFDKNNDFIREWVLQET